MKGSGFRAWGFGAWGLRSSVYGAWVETVRSRDSELGHVSGASRLLLFNLTNIHSQSCLGVRVPGPEPVYVRAKREHLERFTGLVPGSQGHNLALTVLRVPRST